MLSTRDLSKYKGVWTTTVHSMDNQRFSNTTNVCWIPKDISVNLTLSRLAFTIFNPFEDFG